MPWMPGVGQVAFEDKNGGKPWERLTASDIRILKVIIKKEAEKLGGTFGE